MNKGIFVFFVLLALSCGPKHKYDPSDNPKGKSILDIEYINDTLNINVVDFRVEHIEGQNYELEIYMISTDADLYAQDHKFYAHFYPDHSSNFFPFGTNEIQRNGDTLIYNRNFSAALKNFAVIRYGLENKEGKRLFSLHIDSVDIK